MSHKLKTKILLLWVITMAYACVSTEDKLPQGILSEEDMVNIIADINILDATQKTIQVSSEIENRMKDTSYTIVFNKYHTDVHQFDSSLHVYAQYPTKMANIMEEVGKKINAYQ